MQHGYVSSLPRLRAKQLLCALLAIFGCAMVSALPAQAQTKFKMVLNWKYQGPQGCSSSPMTAATSKPRASTSPSTRATAPAPACRWLPTVPMTWRSATSMRLIELAAKKPDDAPIAVYVMYNRPPFTVAVKADSPIKSPKDFEGKTLGGAANDGALKLFPAFCKTRQDRLQQGQDHQHAAKPARADADAGPGRWRVRLRQHHPLLRQADGRR